MAEKVINGLLGPRECDEMSQCRSIERRLVAYLKGVQRLPIPDPDIRDCEEAAYYSMAVIAKNMGLEALLNDRNPETGEGIFPYAMTVSKNWLISRQRKELKRRYPKEESHIDSEFAVERHFKEVYLEELRDVVVESIMMLPPFEQQVVELLTEVDPHLSERKIADLLTEKPGRKVSRHRVRTALNAISKVFAENTVDIF